MAYIDCKHSTWIRYNLPECVNIDKVKSILVNSGKYDPYDDLIYGEIMVYPENLDDTIEFFHQMKIRLQQ
jgi:hypothetical protein